MHGQVLRMWIEDIGLTKSGCLHNCLIAKKAGCRNQLV